MVLTTNKIVITCIVICTIIVIIVTRTLDDNKPVMGRNNIINNIIIDAGHGGEDGGAIGAYGIVEKDINLLISNKLKLILEINGFNVTMTRDSDVSIYNKNNNSIAKKKRSDLKNRLDIVNKNPNSITISIHQNKFSDSKYSGAQMFYGPKNPVSEQLAEYLREAFVNNIQKDNKREVKKGEKNIFILYNANNPMVLIECGFLSNPAEALLLVDDEYQNMIAFTIFCGIMNFTSSVNSIN